MRANNKHAYVPGYCPSPLKCLCNLQSFGLYGVKTYYEQMIPSNSTTTTWTPHLLPGLSVTYKPDKMLNKMITLSCTKIKKMCEAWLWDGFNYDPLSHMYITFKKTKNQFMWTSWQLTADHYYNFILYKWKLNKRTE